MFENYNYSRKYETDRPQISEAFASEMSRQNTHRTELTKDKDISTELITEALISVINHKGAKFLAMTGEELMKTINGYSNYTSKKSA